MKQNRFAGVSAVHKTERFQVHCKVAVDATGDADLSFLSGVPYEKGRPQDGEGVDARVVEETVIFGGENGQDHVRCRLFQRHRIDERIQGAPLLPELAAEAVDVDRRAGGLEGEEVGRQRPEEPGERRQHERAGGSRNQSFAAGDHGSTAPR